MNHARPHLNSPRRRFARVIILAGVFFIAGGATLAQEQLTLRRVEFVGLVRIKPEDALKTSGLQAGDKVTPNGIDAAAEKLMSSGLFKKLGYRVRTADGEATVTFDVEEASRNLPVVFENFVWFTNEEILRAIRQDVPFFDGTSPEGGTTAKKIAAALQRLLNQKKITAQVEFLPYADMATGKQELLFTAKGVTVPICALHFPGSDAIAEAELVRNSQALLKADYSNKNVGEFARYNLFPLYRHIGYLRATFLEPTAKIEGGATCADGVSVTIPVQEGLVYSWDEATWSGNRALETAELNAALGMKAGEIADGMKIDKGLVNVSRAYGKQGYMASRIRNSMTFDDATRRVSFQFAITEGPQFHMGNLSISGLDPEDLQLVKEKWLLPTGSVFNESYVDDFRMSVRPILAAIMQRRRANSPGSFSVEVKPNPQMQTVNVVITFK